MFSIAEQSVRALSVTIPVLQRTPVLDFSGPRDTLRNGLDLFPLCQKDRNLNANLAAKGAIFQNCV